MVGVCVCVNVWMDAVCGSSRPCRLDGRCRELLGLGSRGALLILEYGAVQIGNQEVLIGRRRVMPIHIYYMDWVVIAKL